MTTLKVKSKEEFCREFVTNICTVIDPLTNSVPNRSPESLKVSSEIIENIT